MVNSPVVSVRLPFELLKECKKAIKDGKARNMTELVKKALIFYLKLNLENYLLEL